MKNIVICCLLLFCGGMTMAQNRFHQVQRGETYESIAAKYGCTVDEIKALNQCVKGCYFGIKLTLPPAKIQETDVNENMSSSTSSKRRRLRNTFWSEFVSELAEEWSQSSSYRQAYSPMMGNPYGCGGPSAFYGQQILQSQMLASSPYSNVLLDPNFAMMQVSQRQAVVNQYSSAFADNVRKDLENRVEVAMAQDKERIRNTYRQLHGKEPSEYEVSEIAAKTAMLQARGSSQQGSGMSEITTMSTSTPSNGDYFSDYKFYEERAIDAYKTLMAIGSGYVNEQNQTYINHDSGTYPLLSTQKLFRDAQKKMRAVRTEAVSHGIQIPISEWETKTIQYY